MKNMYELLLENTKDNKITFTKEMVKRIIEDYDKIEKKRTVTLLNYKYKTKSIYPNLQQLVNFLTEMK